MILVGDKIKLVKEMPDGFKDIGRIFIIKNINDGIITFYDNDIIAGCMSYDEFEKYFEKIEKREWGRWYKDPDNRSIEPFGDGTKITTNIFYRSNGKKVQVKCGGYRAEATCHNSDIFDLRTGYSLAKKRLILKMLRGQVDAYAKSL